MVNDMSARTWSDEQLVEAVANSLTYREVCENLGVSTKGSSCDNIAKHVERIGLNVGHFNCMTGEPRVKIHWSKMDNDELFSVNEADRSTIRNALLKRDLITYQCQICGLVDWQGTKLSLQLDHINGHSNDNRLENLRFLCPNCHAQTSTYGGKNLKGKARNGKPLKMIPNNTCNDCGISVSEKDGSDRCNQCAAKHRIMPRKIKWPSDECLIKLIRQSTFDEVGSQLGVSGNAIRKRLKSQGYDPTSFNFYNRNK